MSTNQQQVASKVRVRIFVDYWNFQLNLHRIGSLQTGDKHKFSIDWQKVGPWLSSVACTSLSIDPASHSYDGMAIYSSYDPSTETGKKLKSWMNNWLNRQPGIDVHCLERKAKSPQQCPSCHKEITHCPHSDCLKQINATVEKGVDTLIATDMIRLAWERAYDVAVLVSLDGDLIPAVDFLNSKGMKVIQAGFPPGGTALATACWASFDVAKKRSEFEFIKA